MLAPDQRRQRWPCSASKRPSARHWPATRHAQRLGEALQAVQAEVGQLEQAADQPARRLADHDAAWLGQRLQPGREVRRLADYRLLLCRALADQLADHDQAGGDADPGRQRLACGRGRPTAAAIASPARTARSASSSCAWGQPK